LPTLLGQDDLKREFRNLDLLQIVSTLPAVLQLMVFCISSTERKEKCFMLINNVRSRESNQQMLHELPLPKTLELLHIQYAVTKSGPHFWGGVAANNNWGWCMAPYKETDCKSE
jgi:hypothetical protein